METTYDAPARVMNLALAESGELEAGGVLYFLDGQYLFRRREHGAWTSKFLTSEDLEAAFTRSELDTGWLPAGVVRSGRRAAGPFFVYSAPAQKMNIVLADGEPAVRVPIPRTVLLGIGGGYFLWALKDEHFGADAQACRAPFPNVYSDGRICWGSYAPPEALARNARPVWEMFFRTPFNAHLAIGKTKSEAYKRDARDLLRELAERGANKFPAGELVSENSQIAYLIDQVLR
jgi:PRTRC genetic system protein B